MFARAPFQLPPRKHSTCPVQSDQATAKRRLHRYENVPPLEIVKNEAVQRSEANPDVDSQDLFGLVPFGSLTPATGRKASADKARRARHEDDEPVVEPKVDDAGVNNLSFEDIGAEETEWKV